MTLINKSEYLVSNDRKKNEYQIIDDLIFNDSITHIYYDPLNNEDAFTIAWQARNPDSFYTGYVYLTKDGRFEYPKDAVIPEQNELDREIIPKFVVTGKKEIDTELKEKILDYLEKEHKKRNCK